MNMTRFYVACAIAAVLSIGTFLILDTLYPYKPEEIKVGETAELTDVLSGSLNPGEPEGAPTNIGTTEELKAAPAEAAPESAPAEEAALSEGTAADIEVVMAEKAAEEAAAAEPAPAPEPEPVAAEPEPAPEPAPAPVKPAAKPKPAPKTAAAAPAAPKGKTGTGIQQWWNGDIEGELSLVYAGSAAYKQAIVLLFNGPFDTTDSVNQNVSVKDGSGKVSGSWEISSNNKRMVIFQVPKSGRYQVTVNKGVKDRTGKALKKGLQGPVYVQ